ncbi:hypothetical protein BCR32DRAFT_330156 [Anaeromyces robustus]|uniref:Uncharacterized protein n=1 Tax=Anaeromyces robustus TaxID=1754192 RepID=A0A1Y1W8J6_9FUNG|nr:hypothetical protein BCR32DRAFT_330156 [Anaeromyces robustus]|eukprot:ORX69837.1 hypothetical protein BCR32DRAFT_330156 [Anaeromyces robustus]
MSHCIGNKCITSLYCKSEHRFDMKKADKEEDCSLFLNICDGKPCFKKYNECEKDDDCFSGVCSEVQCNNTVTTCNGQGCSKYPSINGDDCKIKSCQNVQRYSLGSFTRKDAKKYYEK